MKKIIVLFVACFALQTFALVEGNYTYTVCNGEATITDFSTTVSGAIEIPSELDGYPVTSIGYGAFENCSGLTRVTISASVTSIGDFAFWGCGALSEVVIPDGVTYLGDAAFYGCISLISITIPASVMTIGNDALSCPCLESITVESNNRNYSSLNGVLFDKNKQVLIQYPAGGASKYEIPNSVTCIGESAFAECYDLTSVTIPTCVTNIGNDAFFGTGLTNVTIPDGVTSISDGVFHGCSLLTNITIPDAVTRIGNLAFSGCRGLTSMTIPNCVTNIGDYAFYDCSGLTSVVIPSAVTKIGDYAFYGCSSLGTICIPKSLEGYTSSLNNGNSAAIIVMDGIAATVGGVEYVTVADAIRVANSTNEIVVVDGKVVSTETVNGVVTLKVDGEKVEGLPKFYTPKVDGQKVTLELNDKAKPMFGEAEITNENNQTTTEPAIKIGADGEFSLTIKSTESALYYQLYKANELGSDPSAWTKVGTPEKGGQPMQLTAPDGKFFKVIVTDVP